MQWLKLVLANFLFVSILVVRSTGASDSWDRTYVNRRIEKPVEIAQALAGEKADEKVKKCMAEELAKFTKKYAPAGIRIGNLFISRMNDHYTGYYFGFELHLGHEALGTRASFSCED